MDIIYYAVSERVNGFVKQFDGDHDFFFLGLNGEGLQNQFCKYMPMKQCRIYKPKWVPLNRSNVP